MRTAKYAVGQVLWTVLSPTVAAPPVRHRRAGTLERGVLPRRAAGADDGASLVVVSEDLWAAATRHPFLDAVREGAITDAAFDTWLRQDALFVADLLTFQSRLLARAPRGAQQVLVDGCAALVAELDWFEEQAVRRGIDLAAEPRSATLAYRELLQALDDAPFDAAVTALWVIERVYLLSWTSAAPAPAPLDEFVEHWTTPDFAGYVDKLGALAAPREHDDQVESVLRLEVDFWDMALT